MLIANNKFIFVHLQKTGGSFIKEVLPKIDISCEKIRKWRITLHTYYHTDNNLKHHDDEGYHNFCNNHLVFGVVRNPWSWYVSMWKFLRHYIDGNKRMLDDHFPDMKNTTELKEMDINDFVNHIYKNTSNISIYLMNFKNYQDLNVGLYTYEFLRQFTHRRKYDIIEDDYKTSNLIYLDDINNLCIDKFLRFESLSTELIDLMKELFDISDEQCNTIKVHKKMNISDYSEDKKKSSNMKIAFDEESETDDPKKYRKYYNDDTVKLIYEKDGLLIEKFNYSY